jgi:hypothetical protein
MLGHRHPPKVAMPADMTELKECADDCWRYPNDEYPCRPNGVQCGPGWSGERSVGSGTGGV